MSRKPLWFLGAFIALIAGVVAIIFGARWALKRGLLILIAAILIIGLVPNIMPSAVLAQAPTPPCSGYAIISESPFDVINNMDVGDGELHAIVLANDKVNPDTTFLAVIEKTYNLDFEAPFIQGKFWYLKGPIESVVCKAEEMERNSGRGLYRLYVGSSNPPAGWSNVFPRGWAMHIKRFTNVTIEVPGASWSEPINRELKDTSPIGSDRGVIYGQVWDGKDAKLVYHFIVEAGHRVIFTQLQGTYWVVTGYTDRNTLIARFDQMSAEVVQRDDGPTVYKYYIGPTTSVPTGWSGALPSGWTSSGPTTMPLPTAVPTRTMSTPMPTRAIVATATMPTPIPTPTPAPTAPTGGGFTVDWGLLLLSLGILALIVGGIVIGFLWWRKRKELPPPTPAFGSIAPANALLNADVIVTIVINNGPNVAPTSVQIGGQALTNVTHVFDPATNRLTITGTVLANTLTAGTYNVSVILPGQAPIVSANAYTANAPVPAPAPKPKIQTVNPNNGPHDADTAIVIEITNPPVVALQFVRVDVTDLAGAVYVIVPGATPVGRITVTIPANTLAAGSTNDVRVKFDGITMLRTKNAYTAN